MSEELKAALARIACLEGEIAKRDETIARLEPQLNRAIQANYDLREELAACRVAVENCEVFRVRIAELESQFDGESIVCGSYRDERDATLAELATLKEQEPVAELLRGQSAIGTWFDLNVFDQTVPNGTKLYAAPVSEAKAQGVVMPEGWIPLTIEHEPGYPEDVAFGPKRMMDRLKKWLDRYFEMRLNAAPVQRVSVPDDKIIEQAFINAGGKWDGDRWVIEDADLHPFVRSFAATAAPAADAGVNDHE